MRRVARPDETEPAATAASSGGSSSRPSGDSALALDAMRVWRPGRPLDMTDDDRDTLLFAHAGSGSLGDHALRRRPRASSPAARRRSLVAGPDGRQSCAHPLGAATDLHAPMGATEPVVALDHVEPGAGNGRAVVPGAPRPAQRVDAGDDVRRLHPARERRRGTTTSTTRSSGSCAGRAGSTSATTRSRSTPGVAFRLRPREVHIVENTQPDAELAVLGIFTPAGQPVGRVLEPHVAGTYAFSGDPSPSR